MAGWKRKVVGLGVIALGTCAALPFRQGAESSHDRAARTELAKLAGPRGALTLQLAIPTNTAGDSTQASPATSNKSASAPFDSASQPIRASLESLPKPPGLSANFEPLGELVSVSVPRLEPPDREESLLAPQRHRIVDGDTLEGLAERYLGERHHWPLILAANSQTLVTPELLPIGVEIEIPQRTDSDGSYR